MISSKRHLSGTRTDLASLLDLFPTLAAWANVHPVQESTGRNLLAPNANTQSSETHMASLHSSVIQRQGLASGEFLYLNQKTNEGLEEQLFRLTQPNIEIQQQEVSQAMRKRLQEMRLQMIETAESKQKISPEEQQQLEALGYSPLINISDSHELKNATRKPNSDT